MKIVVLDGHTLNPGDLDWSGLRALGECTIHDRTPPGQIVERSKGAGAVLTNKVPLRAGSLDQLPELRYIGVLATGYNIIDVDAALERGVVVTNVPAYGTVSVAQHVFALILEFAHRVGHHSETVRQGRWSKSADWCYWDYPLIELNGLTLGIVGFGRIGQEVAKIARGFGMHVIAYSRSATAGTEKVSLEELLRRSDIVSLHCPLTPETEGLINAARIGLMKPSALLVNTGRGPLIVDSDLAEALNSGRLAGAALDVLSAEPPPATNPLIGAKNCIITPHIAWATRAARSRLMDTVVGNLDAFQKGAPRNVVR